MATDLRAILDEIHAAARRQQRHPRHAIGLALILAIGVGGTMGIFHVAYEALHRPLPYSNADRIVVLPQAGGGSLLVSGAPPYPSNPSLHSVFASASAYFYDSARVDFASRPKKIVVAFVTPHFFSTLGVRPVIGRAWPGKFRPPYPPVHGGPSWFPIVLSYHLWHNYFGADPRIIGVGLRTYGGNGRQYEIVGVAPQGMNFPPAADAWAPAGIYSVSWFQSRSPGFLSSGTVGLLLPGLSIRRAEARITAWRTRRDPLWYSPPGPVRLVSIRRFLAGDVPQLARILWISTLLLLGLATLAAIGICRADLERRRNELEIKSMLGAGINRLQLSLGIDLGLVMLISLLAAFAVRDLIFAATERYFRLALPAALGWREVAMAIVPLLVVLAAALVRQRRILRPRTIATHRARRGIRFSPQWVVTTMILIAASLLAVSGYRLLGINLGLNPRHVFVCELSLPTHQSSYLALGLKQGMSAAQKERVQRENALTYNAALTASYTSLIARIKGSPGISEAGVISAAPYSGYPPFVLGGVRITAVPTPCNWNPGGTSAFATGRTVSSEAFRVLGMTIRYGRGFDPADDTVPDQVVLINEALARHFGGKASLGGYLCFGGITRRGYRVVGIVRNVREGSVFSSPAPTIYYPMAVRPLRTMDAIIRTLTPLSGGDVLGVIRAAATAVAPATAISNFDSMSSMIRSAETENVYAAIYLLALAITSVFLAGVAAWVESGDEALRRRHEIGVRLALGATARHVIWNLINTEVKVGAASVALGGLLAWWFVRLFSHLLFDTGFSEPWLYVAVMLALTGYLALVHVLSVRRALRVNPAELISKV